MMAEDKHFFRTAVGLTLIGAFLGELLPEPTDFIHYIIQKYILVHPDMTRTMWVWLQTIDWYFLSASWYLLLIGIAWLLHIKKVKTIHIIGIIGGLVGLGVTIAILTKFLMA